MGIGKGIILTTTSGEADSCATTFPRTLRNLRILNSTLASRSL
jgi:hypothetical protein